jgi:hypothetical protein
MNAGQPTWQYWGGDFFVYFFFPPSSLSLVHIHSTHPGFVITDLPRLSWSGLTNLLQVMGGGGGFGGSQTLAGTMPILIQGEEQNVFKVH